MSTTIGALIVIAVLIGIIIVLARPLFSRGTKIIHGIEDYKGVFRRT